MNSTKLKCICKNFVCIFLLIFGINIFAIALFRMIEHIGGELMVIVFVLFFTFVTISYISYDLCKLRRN